MTYKEKKDLTEAASYVAFFIVAPFLWRWYSHVWLPHVLHWGLCIVIAVIQTIVVISDSRILRMIFVLILVASLLAQIASWGGAVVLPIIKN